MQRVHLQATVTTTTERVYEYVVDARDYESVPGDAPSDAHICEVERQRWLGSDDPLARLRRGVARQHLTGWKDVDEVRGVTVETTEDVAPHPGQEPPEGVVVLPPDEAPSPLPEDPLWAISSIDKLRPEPGDLVVVKADTRHADIRGAARALARDAGFPEGVKVAVVPEGVSIEQVKADVLRQMMDEQFRREREGRWPAPESPEEEGGT